MSNHHTDWFCLIWCIALRNSCRSCSRFICCFVIIPKSLRFQLRLKKTLQNCIINSYLLAIKMFLNAFSLDWKLWLTSYILRGLKYLAEGMCTWTVAKRTCPQTPRWFIEQARVNRTSNVYENIPLYLPMWRSRWPADAARQPRSSSERAGSVMRAIACLWRR